MIARTALIGVALLAAGAASGQTRFELAVGAQYGLQQEPAFVPGWVVAGGFEIDGQEFVVEAARDRFVRTQEVYGRFDPFDEYPGMETIDRRYLTMAAGIRGGLDQEKRFSPFYQVLVGGFTSRFRTDYDWSGIDVEAENRNCGGFAGDLLLSPCYNLPYEEYEERRRHAFLMQPGVGLDVRLAGRVKARLVTDLLALAHRDWGMVTIPRMSFRIVATF